MLPLTYTHTHTHTHIHPQVNDAYLDYVVALKTKLHYAHDDITLQQASSLGLAPGETVTPVRTRVCVLRITPVGGWVVGGWACGC